MMLRPFIEQSLPFHLIMLFDIDITVNLVADTPFRCCLMCTVSASSTILIAFFQSAVLHAKYCQLLFAIVLPYLLRIKTLS